MFDKKLSLSSLPLTKRCMNLKQTRNGITDIFLIFHTLSMRIFYGSVNGIFFYWRASTRAFLHFRKWGSKLSNSIKRDLRSCGYLLNIILRPYRFIESHSTRQLQIPPKSPVYSKSTSFLFITARH